MNLMYDTQKIQFNQSGLTAQRNASIYYNNTNSGIIIENLNTSGTSKGVYIKSNFDIQLDCFNEILLGKFSSSLWKVIPIFGTGDSGTIIENLNTSGTSKGVYIMSSFDIQLDCFNEILLGKFSSSLWR